MTVITQKMIVPVLIVGEDFGAAAQSRAFAI